MDATTLNHLFRAQAGVLINFDEEGLCRITVSSIDTELTKKINNPQSVKDILMTAAGMMKSFSMMESQHVPTVEPEESGFRAPEEQEEPQEKPRQAGKIKPNKAAEEEITLPAKEKPTPGPVKTKEVGGKVKAEKNVNQKPDAGGFENEDGF